ncbi:MAG: hypothetical protein HY681_08170 [Chloroflexi bacterium]|nr:hypothetical protein [Chloroflexota bacterium]
METKMAKAWARVRQVLSEEKGITGLETAIVLIAFVVVSSVFAFAALSTGLFSSDQAKETINAGLKEAQGTIEVKGVVIGHYDDTNVDEVRFQVSNAAGGDPVNLNQGDTVIRYIDSNETVMFDGSSATYTFTLDPLGNADSDDMLEPGETIEISLTTLDTALSSTPAEGDSFTLQIIPPAGATVNITRTLPAALETVMDLG